MSDLFHTQNCLKEGNVLSPLLFKMALESIIVFLTGVFYWYQAHFKTKPRVKLLRHFACQMLLM